MESSQAARAVSAAVGIAASLGLPAEEAVVLHSSNALTLRLTPCDVVARVTDAVRQAGAQRVLLERALILLAAGCPVGAPAPSLRPAVLARDGFEVTLWTSYEPRAPEVPPEEYASALARLHAGMRTLDLSAPRYTDRIAEAIRVVDDPVMSPELAGADRVLLASTLRSLRRSVAARTTEEQLLHGEPHPGNVLATESGPIFIDLETVCRGPVEFDLAHAPESVSARYPRVDRQLLADCRGIVLAMLAAWRWQLGDDLPNGEEWGRRFLETLRAGAPWPALDSLRPLSG